MIYVIFLGLIILITIGLGIYYYFQPSIETANKKLKWIMGANAFMFITGILLATISIFSGAGFSAAMQAQSAETAASAAAAATNSAAGLNVIKLSS